MKMILNYKKWTKYKYNFFILFILIKLERNQYVIKKG